MKNHKNNLCETRLIKCEECEASFIFKDFVNHSQIDCIKLLKKKNMNLETYFLDISNKLKKNEVK